HEVIVDTNSHDKQLWDKDKNHISELLKVIAKRITEMEKVKCIKYVLAFKNHGEKAGTSILHSHVQLASVAMIPTEIKTKIAAVNEHKRCPYCEIIKIESKSKRKCFENKDFVAFAPYASRFNYEIWFFPKRHVTRMENLKESEISSLAELIHKTLTKLKSINASYNLFIQYSPGKEDLHFHIEITPRIATWAGFEFSSGIVINSVSPESAAGFYRS
ncbi:MAG TPA: DUF4931 domain-containing protein, partial [Candidatus Nanoarchaeia archaeon]|nr:DUF4931 domain-containing protein [Candidatus Nanoarchaeia archaeon]